jgi:hypothetical protein
MRHVFDHLPALIKAYGKWPSCLYLLFGLHPVSLTPA